MKTIFDSLGSPDVQAHAEILVSHIDNFGVGEHKKCMLRCYELKNESHIQRQLSASEIGID